MQTTLAPSDSNLAQQSAEVVLSLRNRNASKTANHREGGQLHAQHGFGEATQIQTQQQAIPSRPGGSGALLIIGSE